MVLRDLVRALLRRWYLLLLGVVLAVSAMYLTWDRVDQRYAAEGSLLLLPPPSSIERILPNRRDGNPLLYLGDLNQARDVVISLMSSDEVREAFADQFPGSSYTVASDPLSSGPIVVITVDSPDPETALGAVRRISSEVATRFSQAQSELAVDKDSQIGVMVLTQPAEAEMENRSQVRATVMVGGAVMLTSVLLVAVIDGLIFARRRRLGLTVDSEASDEDAADDGSADAAEAGTDLRVKESSGGPESLEESLSDAHASVAPSADRDGVGGATQRRANRGRRRGGLLSRPKEEVESADASDAGMSWWGEADEDSSASSSVDGAASNNRQQDGWRT